MGQAARAVRELAATPYGEGAESRDPGSPVPPAGGVPAGGVPAPAPGAGAADPDAIESLGDEIATLAAHIHAATQRFLALVARFDRLGGWEPGGHRSCAHWLAFRTGLDLGAAREHVRVARALERLPETSAAMGRGALSFSQVRALTRVAEAGSEAELLELAEGATAAQLERVVRAWKKGSRQEEAARERERHRSRTLSVFPDEDGMYMLRGRLEPEVGAPPGRPAAAPGPTRRSTRASARRSARAGAPGAAQPGRPAASRRTPPTRWRYATR